MQAAGILAPLRPRGSSLQRMGDESLADRAAAGNDAAFTALYERYHDPLLGYCRSILLDAEDAHDATQSALENALRALPRRDPGRPLRPWLYRIAHNEAINIVRRRQPASASIDPTDLLTVPGPEAETEQRSRLAQLVEDLRLLPERQRGALVMRELSGLSYDEIGLALGMSNDAARRAVFDARSALHDAADGRATECVSVRRCLSDGDRRHLRGRGVRAHLRSCDDCAGFERAMGARQADLFALGPWLGGGGALGLIGLGGAGSGVLVATGGGGAIGGGGLSWAGLPVALKGIAVTAVVATTGTAAIELPKTVRHDASQTSAQAAAVAPAAISRLHDARRELALAQAAAERARRAEAARKAADARLRTTGGGAADLAASRGRSDVEAIVPASPGSSTTPPAGGAQRPSADPPAHAAAISPERGAIDDLEGIREQILAAFESAQALAATGTQAALAAANSLIQTTLGSVSPLLGDVLGSVGLTLPANLATPPPTTTTAAAPTVTNVLAPAQSVLDGVDGVLQTLLGRR